MNIRPPADMLRPQQTMPQLSQVPLNSPSHFIPTQPHPGQQQQQQQPPNHMSLMQNTTNPSIAMLGGGVQNGSNSLQATAARYQMRQTAMQQGQSPQMNASAAAAGASHMAALGHNSLQGMAFPTGMMQHAINVSSAGIEPSSWPCPWHPPISTGPQRLPAHLRQPAQQPMVSRIAGSMPGSMSPDLMGRQANATGVPQNSLRASSAQAQIMSSLSQPSGIPQGGLQQSISQNSFQSSVPGHPHHTPSLISSSPRPGSRPQQQQAANMMMGQPGPSQAAGPRPMSHGDNTFVGLQNHQFPPNMIPGSNRIPNANSAFSFTPSTPQTDGPEALQSISEGLPNPSNPSIRSSFQPTPVQQFEQLQQNNNFGAHFTVQSQGNPPPPARPPSHPSTAHGNSIPPRQMQPPHQHSPHQSDPMAAHVQQPPQRPRSQPQGPPGRPPSQAGPSHTPRSSQSQLPPSSGLLPPARITPHTQTQPLPHQQRQSPSVQQPIAPRPPPVPTSNTPATNAAPSESSTSQSQPAVISRGSVMMSVPVGLGQGLTRLLQFSGQLSSESPHKHQLSHWDALVREYFTPKAIMKVTLWKDNQRSEAKPFEIGVPILPRFFLVTTQSGVKSMTLSLDGARERLLTQQHAIVECVSAVWTYKYANGYTVTLRGPLSVHVYQIPLTGPIPPQQPPYTLKFDQFQFDANTHEKYISLDSIIGQRSVESPKTPRVRNAPTPSPNGASSSQRPEEDRQWEEPRVLIDHASIPGEPVNAFGIPQATMRCLELAESVSQMTDLISFANETQLGPMVLCSGPGPGVFQGYGGATSALYPGMSPSAVSAHSMPSGSSPQNVPPPSADTPQKQSKPPTSGPAPPAPNQPPAPSQAGLTSAPAMPAGTLKRKPNDTNSPTIANVEPQSKRTRKQKRNG
ncbi:hypothetical protein BS17DRAFT_801871 [Gyrodon lividus]|nr:hypothetical protein BS17DRAFT_801871 [Gyrodon lividus]